MSDELTTTEAAQLLRCSPNKVRALIDSGELRGWTVPASTHRRTTVQDVKRYADAEGIPIQLPAKPAAPAAKAEGGTP